MKTLYYNIPQLEVYHVGANRTYCIWGRGTGKTSNALAPYSARLVEEMPRSLIALVGVSYAQILGRVLPGLIQGWERMGYQENVHFFVRKFAPAKYGWKQSYFCPKVGTHSIHWYNGSVITFVSQDRPSLANGYSFDGMFADEARFLNYDQLLELLPALRGNKEHFGDSSFHYAEMYTTDMPTDHRGSWLFDHEEESISTQEKEDLLTLSTHLSNLYLEKDKSAVSQHKKYNRQIQQCLNVLNKKRKKKVFFSMASTLDNVHALGIEPIQKMRKTMPTKRFGTAVLNLRKKSVEVGFYGLFDPDKFGFYGDNHTFLDSPHFIVGSQRDSRWDRYYDPRKPLDVGADFGANFNCAVLGQDFKKVYAVQHQFWAEYPEGIDAVMKQIADYYRFSECKELNFYHDHTAKDSSKNKQKEGITYLDEWKAAAKSHGWKLNAIDIGHTQAPNSRYLLWKRTFQKDPQFGQFVYHQGTCQDLETALLYTGLKEGEKGFYKDKSTEKRDKHGNFPVPQQHAPHLTDALDTLWVGTQYHKFNRLNDWNMTEAVVG